MTIILCIAWSFLAGYAVRSVIQLRHNYKMFKTLEAISASVKTSLAKGEIDA